MTRNLITGKITKRNGIITETTVKARSHVGYLSPFTMLTRDELDRRLAAAHA